MSDQHDQVARLERANDELKASLERCHDLVAEYRDRLAANSNEVSTEGIVQEPPLSAGKDRPPSS